MANVLTYVDRKVTPLIPIVRKSVELSVTPVGCSKNGRTVRSRRPVRTCDGADRRLDWCGFGCVCACVCVHRGRWLLCTGGEWWAT